jgi:hypothetical protein
VQGSHAWRGDSAVFDEDNLVSHAGLLPVLELAERAGLSALLDEHVRFVDERVKSGAANPTPKLTSIIAGMAAGADSIDDLDIIRAGGMTKVFGGVYANATLGIFLREFTHGHTRQLSAVLRRHRVTLARQTPVLEGIGERAFIDIDSLLRPVYGRAKQGASFGHTKIAGKAIPRRGLSPLAVTICTDTAAPVLAGVRLRAGRAGSARGAASMVTEAINTAVAAGAQAQHMLVRGDSAYCTGKVIAAVVTAGATFSFAIARNPAVDAAIHTIPDQAYTPVHYPGAVTDPDTGELISDASVSEVEFTAFAAPATRPPAGWSCAASWTPTPRTRCSRPGATTRSSPPTPSRSTRPTSPTDAMPSARPSGPTSSTDPGPTSPAARLPPTPPGASWPRSPTTCSAPPAHSRRHRPLRRGPRRHPAHPPGQRPRPPRPAPAPAGAAPTRALAQGRSLASPLESRLRDLTDPPKHAPPSNPQPHPPDERASRACWTPGQQTSCAPQPARSLHAVEQIIPRLVHGSRLSVPPVTRARNMIATTPRTMFL